MSSGGRGVAGHCTILIIIHCTTKMFIELSDRSTSTADIASINQALGPTLYDV